MEEKVQQCVCINICFHLGKTGAEMYEMLQAAFRESCLSRLKTFEWMLTLWRRPPPRQADHLPHQGDRGTCARNHSCLPTSDYQRGCRGWNSIRYMPEISNWRIANEKCVSEICALSPDSGAEGRSRVSLQWQPWVSPKQSQLCILSNHSWRKLGLRVWPGNRAYFLPVENCIISSTKESTAGEVQCQDHVDCVLWHWRAGSSWVHP